MRTRCRSTSYSGYLLFHEVQALLDDQRLCDVIHVPYAHGAGAHLRLLLEGIVVYADAVVRVVVFDEHVIGCVHYGTSVHVPDRET